MPEVYYRAYMEPTCDFFSFDSYQAYTLAFTEIRVLSHTRCGVWLAYWTNKREKKFINNNSRKRFAYPTREEAVEALGFRLRSHESHLKAKLEAVQAELQAFNAIIAEGNS